MTLKTPLHLILTFLITAIIFAGCTNAPAQPAAGNSLKCTITAQDYSFDIIGENGTVITTINNEKKAYEYDPSGTVTRVNVAIDRELIYQSSNHAYNLIGTITILIPSDEVAYDISASGILLDPAAKTCQKQLPSGADLPATATQPPTTAPSLTILPLPSLTMTTSPSPSPTPLTGEATIRVSPEAMAVISSWNKSVQAFTSATHPLTQLSGLTATDVGIWNASRLGPDLYQKVVNLLDNLGTPWQGRIFEITDVQTAFTTRGVDLLFTDNTTTKVEGGVKVVFESSTAEKPLAAITPTPDSAFPRVFLAEPFNDDSNDWSTGDVDGDYWVGTRLVTGGVLDWNGKSVIGMFSEITPDKSTLQDNLSDVQVSARVKLLDPSMYGYVGLIVRVNDEASLTLYAFMLEPGGNFAFSLFKNSEWTPLLDWRPSPALKMDDWNKLSVQAVGSHFRVFINDQMVGEADDSTVTSGQNGVVVGAFDPGVPIRVQFDDFEVRVP